MHTRIEKERDGDSPKTKATVMNRTVILTMAWTSTMNSG